MTANAIHRKLNLTCWMMNEGVEMIDFYICPEMKKLRDELKKRGIEWKDNSHIFIVSWICMTHFRYKGYSWSVVHGCGTYGGIDEDWDDIGALECMCKGINGGEPFGYLTADDVLSYMDGIENPERKCKTCKYHVRENVDDGFICTNTDSGYIAYWTDREDWCSEWEGVIE